MSFSDINYKKTVTWLLLSCLPFVAVAGWDDVQQERETALSLIPDSARGAEIYEICAVCHMPEGWGTPNGAYPQIAGQHYRVTVKQLADIRAGNRDNPSMLPFAMPEEIGGPQAIADVAAFIEHLKMTSDTGKGSGADLEHGESLYRKHCRECHGVYGEGDADKAYPLLQAQHYNYLLRQLQWIQNGKRRNANKDMMKVIEHMTASDLEALADYLSRLTPVPDKLSPDTWQDRR